MLLSSPVIIGATQEELTAFTDGMRVCYSIRVSYDAPSSRVPAGVR
jgi:hypothetical protein